MRYPASSPATAVASARNVSPSGDRRPVHNAPKLSGVMLSASASMLTPFEPSCILVYGPGKYRFTDFIKVGGGLTVVMLLVVLTMVPMFWPLK